MRATFLAALITLALSGCDQHAADMRYEQYLSRLNRALSVEVPAPGSAAYPRPLRTGAVQLPIPADKLGTLDFLALTGCEVQVNIGRRNSSLGRLARPSQQLLLALEFLRLAPDCIAHLGNTEQSGLAQTLQDALHSKRGALPALIFNATLGSDEYRSFWLPTRAAGTYPHTGDSSVSTSLAAINAMTARWLAGDYNADENAFELALADIAGGGGGELIKALAVQEAWLLAADEVLRQRMARGPLCGPSLRHRSADILPRVVQRFFIDGIQPAAAVMESRRYAVFPLIEKLEATLEAALPSTYREWAASRTLALENAASAPRRHVQEVQRIMAPCGGIAGAQR